MRAIASLCHMGGSAICFSAFVAGMPRLGPAQHAATDPNQASEDIRVQDVNAKHPQLIFACDRQTNELDSLFTPQLISDLKELKAGVALSLEDLSPGRAKMVQELNAAGIPMMAWIVLPKEQGYYVNASNASQTATRFRNSTSGQQAMACSGRRLDSTSSPL